MKLAIELDKKLHLLSGYTITLSMSIVFGLPTGILSGVLCGIGKEIYDWYDYGVFDKRDMFFTWLGTALAGLLVTIS